MLSFGPFSALYFSFYESFKGLLVQNDVKSYLKKVNQEGQEGQEASHKSDIGFFKSMACSMFAGSAASLMTNPLDMGKLRLQVQRVGAAKGGDAKSFYYRHLADAIYKIGRDEGIRSLFNGSLARIMYHVPMTAISMAILEQVKPVIQKQFDRLQ